MHCNLRPPEPRQPLPALITTPCQVWSHSTYPLPYYGVFAADTLLYAVIWTFDPVTLTFDHWPWTSASYHLWRDETLYQISTQTNNSRRSYCVFSVWTYDLKHCVTCCARLWDKFHQVWPSTTYTCLNYSVFLCWYIMSRCDLDLWPVDLELFRWYAFVQNMIEIGLNYWFFSNFCTYYFTLWPWSLTSWPWNN